MTVLIDVLAVIGALTVTSLLLLTAVVWHVHRLRRKRDAERNAELFAALVDAMEHHPAGSRAAIPAYAPCGAVLGLSTDGWWELQFRAIAHVESCSTCRIKVEREAA